MFPSPKPPFVVLYCGFWVEWTVEMVPVRFEFVKNRLDALISDKAVGAMIGCFPGGGGGTDKVLLNIDGKGFVDLLTD